jgi:hypothetical protein
MMIYWCYNRSSLTRENIEMLKFFSKKFEKICCKI